MGTSLAFVVVLSGEMVPSAHVMLPQAVKEGEV